MWVASFRLSSSDHFGPKHLFFCGPNIYVSREPKLVNSKLTKRPDHAEKTMEVTCLKLSKPRKAGLECYG